jgi:hypothetical protein
MDVFNGTVGRPLLIPFTGEIEAIGFASTVSFEFRVVRNGQVTTLPLAIASLAEWQSFVPDNQEPCHTTLYPKDNGTRGLEVAGLGIETHGLFVGTSYTLFVWRRP